MIDRIFLDTNVLVYLYDESSPEKQARSRAILQQDPERFRFIISTQVLQEFYVTVTRKLPRRLGEDDAVVAMRGLQDFPVIKTDVPLIFEAIGLGRKFQLSFWDALVIQAALVSGCTRLLTEDLQHGMRIGTLTIENPFLSS